MSSVLFYFKGFIFTECLIFYLISIFSANLNASPFLLVWKGLTSTASFALPLSEERKWIPSDSYYQQVYAYWQVWKWDKRSQHCSFLLSCFCSIIVSGFSKTKMFLRICLYCKIKREKMPKGRKLLKAFAGVGGYHLTVMTSKLGY